MGGHDDHQQVQGKFQRLPVFRIEQGEDGENKEKLIAGFPELQEKTDEIGVDHRHDEAGEGRKMKRTCHDHEQGLLAGRYGEDRYKGIIQDSIFFSQFEGGKVWGDGAHEIGPCCLEKVAAPGKRSRRLRSVGITTRMQGAAQAFLRTSPVCSSRPTKDRSGV